MLKELLPPIIEQEMFRHAELAQKGHLGSKEMKEFQTLDQQKRESNLTPQERQAYEEIRSLQSLTNGQKLTIQKICDKAGVNLPRKFRPLKDIYGPSSTAKPVKAPWYYYVAGSFLAASTIVVFDILIGAIINNAKTGWIIRAMIGWYFIAKFPQNLAERRKL